MIDYVNILRAGEIVGLPTETVYGLAGDATNDQAVAKIFNIKGRPTFNPLIVHVPDSHMIETFAVLKSTFESILQLFWPGPLTVVLPLQASHGISPLVTAGLDTVAVRIPNHPKVLACLNTFGRPIAAPSANISGKVSPTSVAHVKKYFPDLPVLDGGVCAVGLESTILDLSGDTPKLLRPGGISLEALEEAFGQKITITQSSDIINAPGQLSKHYAPDVPLRLNAQEAEGDELLLGFGEVRGDYTLSRGGDLQEAAANLFHMLHIISGQKRPVAVSPIPDTGLGRAINDRLRRAACKEEG